MDTLVAARSPTPQEQHSPTSSSSAASDKENLIKVDLLSKNRVRSIVSEFNKIADECDAVAKRQAVTYRNQSFQRQGFKNASMHVIPSGFRPVNSCVSQKASSDSLNSILLEGYPAKTTKLDRLTALQAACAQTVVDEELDVGDVFAVQTRRIRLQNRYADLVKLRNNASIITGGKRTAIIDKKARQCLNDADQKLNQLREHIDFIGHLQEKHRYFEKLYEELYKWISDLERTALKLDHEDNQQIDSVQKQMHNEHANFEKLLSLSNELGAEQRTQWEQVAGKWMVVEQTIHSLKRRVDSAHTNQKLNEAIGQLANFLGKAYDLNTPVRTHKQPELIDEIGAVYQTKSSQPPCVQETKETKDAWTEPRTPQLAQASIYDDCAIQSISTSPSTEHSIPVSSLVSSRIQFPPTEPIELHTFLETLQNYNKIKFAAYRCGMKLFAVQKRLCLDLVEISELDREFKSLPAGIAQIPCESLFTVLRRVYEKAHLTYPRSVPDVQNAIHRCEELIRKLSPSFDTRIIMLILIVLCNGKLDDKYQYLFLVYATGNDNTASATDLRSLFGDLAKLPTLLGEHRTFGVSNVESTVRSCLRSAVTFHNQHSINEVPLSGVRVLPSSIPTNSVKSVDFLRWICRDPQTLVWIRVLHRLARSEFVKHSARCAGCKMQPIVGIRFRCLHCFNVDLCQTCFFIQRPTKGHKSKHEMHEYYVQTSTLDNVRDFTQIVHNKVRRSRSSNKIGYTPIDFNATIQDEVTTPDNTTSSGMQVNVDAVIEQARREGRLPPPKPPQRRLAPMSSRGPNLNGQRPAALSLTASPEDLSRLIVELQRENTALWQAFDRRQRDQGVNGGLPDAVPPLLRRFDSSTRELAEAMNCLLSVTTDRVSTSV